MVRDEGLATQVRELVAGDPGVDERRMFGSLIFMVDGNMACGVRDDGLLVRVGKEATEAALAEPHVTPFEMGGGRRPGGWVVVGPAGLASEAALRDWVGRGVAYARTLPAK
ncbi:TfoX N-terminal domain-containing protein [Asanoa hainanensis]|uniref:TfoX N-terminal domain-containing protein n=1 Tax=Asanoa hainanensis TaxID=560556 RepID=A0A239PER5_9ACTN|nr:TfoX/Sxy family protein [Asanoa hainanensis]SNT65138.1 TfoX N-terminal domain-containing protein [Asanoa hainanensis]